MSEGLLMEKTTIISFTFLLFLITTTTNAQEWEFVGLDSMVIKHLYISGDSIWAGTAHRVGNQNKSGLYFSSDNGNNWVKIDTSLGGGVILGLKILNSSGLLILKGTSAYSVSGTLYKSFDNGETWEDIINLSNNPIQWFGVSPFNDSEIYAIDVLFFPAGVLNFLYKSTDDGNSWNNISAFPASSHGSALAFAFDLLDSMNLNVTVDTQFDQYFYKSTNKGESWFFISTPPSWGAVYTDYFITNRIYLFPQPFISNNGGQNWFLADSGLADTSYYLSYHQDQETIKLLYSLRRDGLYSSRNDTIYWNFVEGTENLPIYFSPTGFYDDRNMNNIFIEPERKELYLGTAEGIYKTAIITNVEADNKNELVFSLSQNFPNPFNSSTIIEYSVNSTSFVSVKVYDVLGREIAALVNEEKLEGNYKVSFDASKLSSGIYFYRLQSGEFIETRKMVLAK